MVFKNIYQQPMPFKVCWIALDYGQIAYGIFIALEKTSDAVSHDILLEKLNHYGITGISNDSFMSSLKVIPTTKLFLARK